MVLIRRIYSSNVTLELKRNASNSAQLHPYCQQKDIVKYCNKHGIVVQAYSPLVQGKIGDDLAKIAASTKVYPRV